MGVHHQSDLKQELRNGPTYSASHLTAFKLSDRRSLLWPPRPSLNWKVSANRLKLQLADLGDLRPGSLVERYRKCGKPNCHCAEPDEADHRPSWSLRHGENGRTVTRIIPPSLVPQTREQLAEYQRLRD